MQIYLGGFWFTGMSRFQRLPKVAKLVMTLLHSNANAERVFSMIRLNKTKTRNSLAPNGTLFIPLWLWKWLASNNSAFEWEPPTSVIKASKSATATYNAQHTAWAETHKHNLMLPWTCGSEQRERSHVFVLFLERLEARIDTHITHTER